MRLKVHPAPRADFVILTYLDFWYAPVSSSSLGQIIIWGVFLGEEIEAESKSLGRGWEIYSSAFALLLLQNLTFLARKVSVIPMGFLQISFVWHVGILHS